MDVEEYFEKFVKNYKPYRDIPEYQRIINVITKYFNVNNYDKIIKPFKIAFEDQIIPKEFYNNLLLSIGFPENIVSKFNEIEKVILLTNFMDYNRYKGTIDQIKKIGITFNENIGIYELYIDFKEFEIYYYYIKHYKKNEFLVENKILFDYFRINDVLLLTEEYKIIEKIEFDNKFIIRLDRDYNGLIKEFKNFKIKRWCFIPELIYKKDSVVLTNKIFPYEDVYNATRHYFVNIKDLENEYKNKNIVLPIKSNLIFLDYNKFYELNTISNLISSIFLKEYAEHRIILYFKDGDYSTNLERVFKLWFYILCQYYNYDYINSEMFNLVIYDTNFINYNIQDVDEILNKYEKISNLNQFSQFYNEYIESKLKIKKVPTNNIKLSDLYFLIRNTVGKELVDYVDSRKNEYKFVLDEILYSIITWVFLSDDEYIKKYSNYFINTLTLINYSIKDSPSYNLIHFLKPFHVELISELSEILVSKGKENIVLPDYEINLFLNIIKSSTYLLSDYLISQLYLNNYDNCIIRITNSFNYNLNILSNIINNIKQCYNFLISIAEESNLVLVVTNKLFTFDIIQQINKSLFFIVTHLCFNIIKNNQERIQLKTLLNNQINYVKDITNLINNKLYNYINSSIKNNLNIVSNLRNDIDIYNKDTYLLDILLNNQVNYAKDITNLINNKLNNYINLLNYDIYNIIFKKQINISLPKYFYNNINIDKIFRLTKESKLNQINYDNKFDTNVLDYDSSGYVNIDNEFNIISSKYFYNNVNIDKIFRLTKEFKINQINYDKNFNTNVLDYDSSGYINIDNEFNLYLKEKNNNKLNYINNFIIKIKDKLNFIFIGIEKEINIIYDFKLLQNKINHEFKIWKL